MSEAEINISFGHKSFIAGKTCPAVSRPITRNLKIKIQGFAYILQPKVDGPQKVIETIVVGVKVGEEISL